MNIFLSLLLFFSPLSPMSDIPSTAIWLGHGHDLIEAEKLLPGHVLDKRILALSPYDFVRLKSAIEGETGVCEWAITSAVNKCVDEMKMRVDIAINRESRQGELISAYETRLKTIEDELDDTRFKNELLLWSTITLGILSAVSITIIVK